VFVIEPGDIYRVSEVKLTGNKAFNSREIAPATQAIAGKLYSHSSIKADEEMISNFYGVRGYADATVDTRLQEVGRGLMKVAYTINEGKKYLLQVIQISGNVKVKEEAIRKRFKLASGDAFNYFLIDQGRQELLKTGRFESVQVSTPEAKPGYKNLEVTVVEK
jgi:outer membrane protein insertion porin family